MRIYLGIDNTDDQNTLLTTGPMVHNLCRRLPRGFSLMGILQHQLPLCDDIHRTGQNRAFCAVIDGRADSALGVLREQALEYVKRHAAPGSSPGLCLARKESVEPHVVQFGQTATSHRLSRERAMRMATNIELYGLGGDNDGVIGALAAVGLTAHGWCGQFVELTKLGRLGPVVSMAEVLEAGVRPVSVDNPPLVPLPEDTLLDADQLRPLLWGGTPVLQVQRLGRGHWIPAGSSRAAKNDDGSVLLRPLDYPAHSA